MRLQIAPGSSRNQWLIYQHDQELHQLLDGVLEADASFVDLDDTIAACQATDIIRRNVISGKHSLPDIVELISRRISCLGEEESVREKHWRWYKDEFIPNNGPIEKALVKRYTSKFARDRLFLGAAEVHQKRNKDARRYIVTRNNRIVAWAFAQALEFQGYHPSAFKKVKPIQRVIGHHLLMGRQIQRAVVYGNSRRDCEMVHALGAARIPTVGVYVTSEPCHAPGIMNAFQIQVSRNDQRLLANYLKNRA